MSPSVHVSDLSEHLQQDERGIWHANAAEGIAYPESGNADCFDLEDRSYWFRHRNDCILALVKAFPPDGPILDVGGGNGFVSQALLAGGFESVLLEPGPVGALNAKLQRKIPNVICSTLRSAQFKPGCLAAVGLFDVLEHLSDDAGTVADLTRALEPNGLFFGTVPAHRWLWSAADVSAQHVRRYSRRSLLDLFSPDYDVLYAGFFFQALTLPIFTLRALPFALGLSKPADVEARFHSTHGTDEGLAARAIARLLGRERSRIERGVSQTWGASLLFVARKRAQM